MAISRPKNVRPCGYNIRKQYVEDLGLIRTRPEVTIANRIYAEVIPRELTWIAQTRITQQQDWFLRPDRSLDKEAGPQLLLQAFLQRIVLELKLWRRGLLDTVIQVGVPQTLDYARQCGADEAHLLIFDRRPDSNREERIWQQHQTLNGYEVQVWGA